MSKPSVVVKNGRIEFTPAAPAVQVFSKADATAKRHEIEFELAAVTQQLADMQGQIISRQAQIESFTAQLADLDAAIAQI